MKLLVRLFLIILMLHSSVYIFAQQKPFYEEIQNFKKQDSLSFPPAKTILFVGSSSFRKWENVQSYFPGYNIINRGFGGSTLPDVIGYVNDIIIPYKPKQIVIYCGDNDLAASDTITPSIVCKRFQQLFFLIRNSLPGTRIDFISIKPSPSRERLINKIKESNTLIRVFLSKKKNTGYIDVYNKMILPNGKPRPDIFVEDKLHMNEKGYAIWQEAIRPYLLK